MESAVVKPDTVPPFVVATLESSSSCCLLALLAEPTVSNLVWGEHSTLVMNSSQCERKLLRGFIVVNVDFRFSRQYRRNKHPPQERCKYFLGSVSQISSFRVCWHPEHARRLFR